MKYRDEFLKLALETGIITVTEDRVTLDPYFGGNGNVLRLAALACREAISDGKNDIYTAGVYMGFEDKGYPLLAATALEYPGGFGWRGFIHRYQLTGNPAYREAMKQWLSNDPGRIAIIIGTNEEDHMMHVNAVTTGRVTMQDLAAQSGIPCHAAVFLYSSCVDQQNNRNVELPIVRVLTEQMVRARAAELKELEPVDIGIDEGRSYQLPG